MSAQDAPWRDNLTNVTATFPRTETNIVILAFDKNRDEVQSTTDNLEDDLRQEELFRDIFAPSTFLFFSKIASCLWLMSSSLSL